jgi:hypothetical protein
MNKVLQVDNTAHTMTVQGQMTLHELFQAATAVGMSPHLLCLPGQSCHWLVLWLQVHTGLGATPPVFL